MSAAFWRLWGAPLCLGLLSTSGLISALLSDGWGDHWSWWALGLPLLVMAWFGWRREATPEFESQ